MRHKRLRFVWIGLTLLLNSGCTPDISTSEPVMNPPAISPAALTDPRIRVMGRTEPLADGGLRFAYPGVTLTINVAARELLLHAHSSSDQSYLEFIIDDGEPNAIKLSTKSQRIPLFVDGNPSSTRRVEIIHRSETWHGLVTLENLEIIDGTLLAAPPLPARRLLILGDSVTCGEAIERTANCKKDTSWWNPRLSYGMLTAKALDAQVNLVCYGGRGLIRSWNGRTDELNLPDFFELSIADPQSPVRWDHERYTPDLILSAIGTNDFSEGIPAREAYVSTYTTLIKRLLKLHPNAQIALTEGAILKDEKKATLVEYLKETARRIDDTRLHVIPATHYSGDSCDAHPTKEQHAAMAKDLIPALRPLIAR